MKRIFLSVCLVIGLWQCMPNPSHAEETSRPITAWPLLYLSSDATQAETDFLWPFVRYERNGSRRRYALRPFFFSTEGDPDEGYRKTSVLWPLNVYEQHKDDLSLHIFPVYWYRQSLEHRYNIFFPVYWNGESENSSYFHIWPIYGVNKRGSSFTEHSTLYPFFRYGRDALSGEQDIHFLWPLVNYHRARDYLSHRLLPLYWYERSPEKSGGFLFPYYWRNTSNFTSRGVFPLWYSSSGQGIKTDLIFPIYYNRKIPESHTQFVLPTYFSWKTEKGSLRTVFPLYFDYAKNDLGIRIGLPIYFRYRNGSFKFTSVFPLYYRTEDTELKTSMSYFFPLYGYSQRGENVTHRFFLFPLYARLDDPELQLKGWDILWPFFQYASSPDTFSVRVLPFYLQTKTPKYELKVGFPFYWSYTSPENSYSHFIPFYSVTKQGDWSRRFFLGPAYVETRDISTGLFRQDVLFPIFSRMEKGVRKRSWLIPIYYHQNDSRERFSWVVPTYFHYADPDRSHLHVWPLYHRHLKGSYREDGALWPFIRFGRDPKNHLKMTQLLIYYSKKDNEQSVTSLVPLWLHKATTRKITDASLFLHWYARDKENDRTKLSFLWLIPPTLLESEPLMSKSAFPFPGDFRITDVSLIRYERTPSLLKHAVFPLYSYEHNDQTDSLSWSFIWPFFSHQKNGSLSIESSFLWKVITYEERDSETSDFRFLWRFIRKSKTKDSAVFEFNPLFYYESKEGKGSYWAILGGLFGMETTGEGKKKVRWLWFF